MKLCQVADLALMHEKKISWLVLRKLLVNDTQLSANLDFYHEAFANGL